MAERLSILIVATKSPWPPVDGGRVVVLNTVDALAAAGHLVTLVAPVDAAAGSAAVQAALGGRCRAELVPVRARAVPAAALSSVLRGRPLTVERHRLWEVEERVRRLLAAESFDVVQAEQVQAVAQAAPAGRAGVPLVYRAHNVESALWTYAAAFARPLAAMLLRLEARRLAAAERAAVRRADATIVLTELDAAPMRRAVGPGPRIERLPVPHAARLPAADAALAGRPAVVTLASPSWMPSRETALQVAAQWWPVVRRRLPGAILHCFGGVDGGPLEGVEWHGAPADSAAAFPRDAVLAIPARHPTGVPVKALEAWARGLPVVASSETAAALEATAGRELVVTDGPEALAEGLERLVGDPALRARLVEGGRARLRSHHDQAIVAGRLAELYRSL
ncbi:MAG TPA: glycosyltransferase family 4 protein [Thermoanaerobaculales bacterium]|nr:glycosyltransferase family 4 protein [Thermoanaerobaculales bacterium]HQN94892.1 glycosyltransferase family 4 protein [Thermoanaerobaculales bacterium]